MIMNTWIENMVHKISDLGIAPVPVIDNCLLQDNIYLVRTGCYRVPELNSNQKARLNSQGPLSTLDNGFQVQYCYSAMNRTPESSPDLYHAHLT